MAGIDRFSTLKRSIETGDVDQIRKILTANPKQIHLISSHGVTLLHLAAWYGHIDLLQWLLSQKEWNLDQRNEKGSSLLHYGVISKSISTIDFLLNLGLSIDPTDARGRTPLHLACRREHGEMIEFLLSRGSQSISIADSIETTKERQYINGEWKDVERKCGVRLPIHFLLRWWSNRRPFRCSLDTVKRMLDLYPLSVQISSQNGQTPLHMAVAGGCLELVELLIDFWLKLEHDQKLDRSEFIDAVTENQITPFHFAVFYKHRKIMRLLVQHGSSWNIPDKYGKFPIHTATIHGSLKILKEIVTISQAEFVINQSVPSDRMSVEELLSIHDIVGGQIIHIASSKGYFDIVRYLVETLSPSVLDRTDTRGNTAIHHLAYAQREEILEWVLRDGNPIFSLNLPNNLRNTPLTMLCKGWMRGTPKVKSKQSAERFVSMLTLMIRALRRQNIPTESMDAAFHRIITNHNEDIFDVPSPIETFIRLGYDRINEPIGPRHLPIIFDTPRYGNKRNSDLLRALGAEVDLKYMPEQRRFRGFEVNYPSRRQIELLTKPLDEDWVYAIRQRVYFNASLTSRLLFEL